MKKIALIFGVTGQDGAYLSKFLLKKGYIVHGVKKKSSFNTSELMIFIKTLTTQVIFIYIMET